ncbi:MULTISPECIES: AMP-dependent synthetase/ligase [Streptomyces]|uniref:Acyl-CoA synthetase n=1 Tax=Streptomyces thermoviolaceus subsp. thermoviolaceus TaxID=66860 RepID=A0ABX0YVU9_STRTL|nr:MULTISPECIES: AMP-dependent synthetase/ligase [Streptomyces]MCM3265235.1 AMP-dependent synthetase/ligase [Streptomyces thermoviolaceus]NJP16742.1 long-chain fatty acid--CoA ligase [Streptomyces thermoviolaceus subsp. thermoviolaceus]RSS04026.1 long-chain fatty acid--CoA ligase [Streptomyces sp. WAC00469]WTD49554.1 AMP-dependent synthetase/ligase [Streptomyces thermoviolaceus]GGV61778.1 long-chain-fatty-acid--CoA ligase [Streptomyces thermoviolaceus subsp. apingens]
MREFSLPALYEVPTDGNLTDIVRRNAAQHPDVAVIARKENGVWRDVSAREFLAEVQTAAKGLIAAGVQPGDRVGLMSRTRYEWTLLDFAIWSAGAVTVPVYETSSAEQVRWILGDSGATACVVETGTHAATVESVREGLPALKHVWQIDAGAVEELGRLGQGVSDETVEERSSQAKADDPATIVYTSGTTGRPKGCVLTHRSFFAECGNVVERLRPLFRTGECSVLLFLPLAHVLGRLVQIAPMMAPIKLGCVPDIKNLTEELASFRPTLILGVPRVFEKVYNAARSKAQAEGKGKIFDTAADTAIAYSKALDTPSGPSLGLRLKHKVFDALVYSKLRAVLGGRGEYAISGGAPLGERLGHFFRGIGFTVLEGYGLTESCAATAFNPWDRPKIGTVGQPLPGSVVRIADDGEVLLHGEHLFKEYWKNPEATAEALADGWFHTGDIGTLDEDGYLRITGRKKELIVTAGGKNVAPAVIEDRIRAHPLVAECMVVGDGRPFVGALITLDEEFLGRWAAEHGKPAGSTVASLRDDPDLQAAVQAAVDDGNAAVSKAESVRKFRILDTQFTEESGHLTPSLKLKRNVVAKDFADEIEALYAK